jgi:DNA-binding MarR family transcriptional regulator
VTDEELAVRQNEAIISLLGRIAFPNDRLKEMIQKGSHKPNEMLAAYNLCDGANTITKIAKQVGVAQPSLSVAIDKWEQDGIIVKRKEGLETFPRKLYTVE